MENGCGLWSTVRRWITSVFACADLLHDQPAHQLGIPAQRRRLFSPSQPRPIFADRTSDGLAHVSQAAWHVRQNYREAIWLAVPHNCRRPIRIPAPDPCARAPLDSCVGHYVYVPDAPHARSFEPSRRKRHLGRHQSILLSFIRDVGALVWLRPHFARSPVGGTQPILDALRIADLKSSGI